MVLWGITDADEATKVQYCTKEEVSNNMIVYWSTQTEMTIPMLQPEVLCCVGDSSFGFRQRLNLSQLHLINQMVTLM